MSEKRFGIFRRRSRTKAYGMVTADPVLLSALSIIDGSLVSYGTAYRQLAPLRTVVDFLADNVADTPLKQYRRTLDGRPELYEHPMAVLLRNPAPGLTGRRLIWGTVADRAVYGQAYWRKIPAIRPKALVPLPPPRVTPVGGDLLEPQAYDFYPVNGATPIRIPRDQIVHFHSYDPEDRRIGSSKVEALRNVLREEVEASRYRTGFWTNHARIEGILEHPGSISQDALTRLQAQFDQAYTGYENSGRTAILEEGMSWKGVGYSARDAEFVQGRQFVLEVCCRIYNVPLSLLGLSQTATYASQKEFHRQLYCVTPDTPILTADLSYLPAGKLANGDEVFAFDEEATDKKRGLRIARVTNTTRGIQPLVRVTTTHSTVVVSEGHPFLVTAKTRRNGRTKGCFEWVRADALDPREHSIVSLGPVWEREETHEAGWLAGIVDGEGYAVRCGGVGIVQKEGPTLDRIEAEVMARGYRCTRHNVGRAKGVRALWVNGGLPECLRFFGTIRPERLIAKRRWVERANIRSMLKAEVLSVEHLGEGEVVELSTSTRTFIAAGLFSHNTEVLPPWFSEVESEIDAQLLPAFDDTRGVYSEFTVESKLRGDFSQQAEYLSKALGGGSTPGFMTIAEVREKLNLPRLEDPRADALIVPLNVSLGGEEEAEEPEEEEVPLRAAALRHFFERQERAVLAGGSFDRDRWNRELTDLVHDKTLAERINLTTEFDLAVAEDPREAFERARNERALELAEER